MRLSLPEVEWDGPIASIRGASAELLRDLLARLDDVVSSVGPNLDELCGPGLSQEGIRQKLRAIDLEPNSELVEWFGWRNGPRKMPDGRHPYPIPGLAFISLDEATRGYAHMLDWLREVEADDELSSFGHGAGWLSLESNPEGVIVNCEMTRPDASVRMTDVEFGSRAPGEPARLANSLSVPVTWILQGLEAGAYEWDDRSLAWKTNTALLPDMQVAAGF